MVNSLASARSCPSLREEQVQPVVSDRPAWVGRESDSCLRCDCTEGTEEDSCPYCGLATAPAAD